MAPDSFVLIINDVISLNYIIATFIGIFIWVNTIINETSSIVCLILFVRRARFACHVIIQMNYKAEHRKLFPDVKSLS